MAVSSAVLDVLEEENLQENARTVGSYMIEQLKSLQDRHDIIGDVRGAGLLVGVELVKDRVSKEPATAEAETVKERSVDRGHNDQSA